MTTQFIDPTRYINSPRVGVRAGLSLGRMMLAAVPDDPAPNVLFAAELLQAAVEDLAAEWTAKMERRSTEDARPYDHHLDRTWSAVHSSLERYATLAPDHPDRGRAAELHTRLFPTGLDFITLPYLEQHAASNRRIELFESEGLRDDLDRLVGESFIDELIAAHEAYGVALEITEATDQTPPASLVAPLRALTRAISRYALQVLAFADLDPQNVPVARRALEPIDVVRRGNARRKSSRAGIESEWNDDRGAPSPTDVTDAEVTTDAA